MTAGRMRWVAGGAKPVGQVPGRTGKRRCASGASGPAFPKCAVDRDGPRRPVHICRRVRVTTTGCANLKTKSRSVAGNGKTIRGGSGRVTRDWDEFGVNPAAILGP